MEKKDKPSYYAVIPSNVRYDEELPANAKLLYGEISALINKDGFCFASNAYFAEVYTCSEDSVSRWISELGKRGYIRQELIRDKKGQIVQRKLYLSVSVPEIHPVGNFADTSPQNCGYPIGKNAEDTNTSITDIKKENIKRKKAEGLSDEAMGKLFVSWIQEIASESWSRDDKNALYFELVDFYAPRANPKKNPDRSETQFKKVSNMLLRNSGGNPRQMIGLLENATGCSWKMPFPSGSVSAAKAAEPREAVPEW